MRESLGSFICFIVFSEKVWHFALRSIAPITYQMNKIGDNEGTSQCSNKIGNHYIDHRKNTAIRVRAYLLLRTCCCDGYGGHL